MINKKELYKEVNNISYEILDEIISPVCGIPKGSIWADIFSADIACYTMGDEKRMRKFIKKFMKNIR